LFLTEKEDHSAFFSEKSKIAGTLWKKMDSTEREVSCNALLFNIVFQRISLIISGHPEAFSVSCLL